MGTGVHRNNFDALRLIAASAVLFSHQFALMGGDEPRPFQGLTLGTFAVYVFFAISGFLVAESWRLDPHPLRFVARRTLRIAPAWVVVVVVVNALLWMAGRESFPENPWGIVNGSLWTIPLEIQCYVVFLILAATTRFGPLLFAVVCLAIGNDNPFEKFAGFFAMGALLSAYPVLLRPWVTVGMVGAGLAICLASPYYGTILIVAPLAVAFGRASWPIVRNAGRYGDFSYGIYVWAYPIQQTYVLLLGKDQPYLLLAILSAMTTLAVAILSWRLVEKPALGLKRYLSARNVSGEGLRVGA